MKEPTLAKLVERFYARGSETAYVHRRGYRTLRWSYRKVAESTRQLTKELQQRGIVPGDRILLWGEDCPEWVVAFFACVSCGAVAVPLDRIASLEFARRILRDTEARLCICSREQQRIDPALPVLIFEDFSELLARHSPLPPPLPDLKSGGTAEIVFTSGTTAEPKGVMLSHKNILANLAPLESEIGKYAKYERIFHPLRFLNLLPLSHVFGQFLGLFIPQIMGSTVIFQQTLNPSEIIGTIKKERVSVLVTVPRILDTIRDKVERDLEMQSVLGDFRKKLEAASGRHFIKRWWTFRSIHRQFGWKFWAFISGGASLSAGSEMFWGRLGFVVIQGYGLTETTSLISVNHPFRLGKGSIGQVLPGREVKLAPDGEILVRGESIAQDYYQGGERKPVPGEGGWFHTGDMGALDENGNLYFRGRRKNVIVSPEGMNIYPEDLEAALRRQPEIRDCVVFGLERSGRAEPCAVLLLHGKESDPSAAIRRANESLAQFQQIRRWLIWPEDDFPRTSTQKPQIGPIREFAELKSAGAAAGGTSRGIVAELIRGITGREFDTISASTDLIKDLNLSSIERVELVSALEDRLQTDIDESHFTAASTIGDLEQMLQRPSRKRPDFRYPRWHQSAPAAILRTLVYYLLVWPAMQLMAHPRIRGRENIRSLKGPVLFVSNHITQVDIGFILAALPLRLRHRLAVAMNGEMLQEMREPPQGTGVVRRWMEKASYGLLLSLFNVFPLPQKSGYRESFAFAGESVDRGFSVLVFPEGTRTQSGDMSPFRAGIGLLATRLGVPAVPIRIDGLFELKKKGRKFARPGTVSVTLGPAVRYKPESDASAIAVDLQQRVRSL